MRRITLRTATALVAATAIISTAPVGAAANRSDEQRSIGIQGDTQDTKAYSDKDNRKGKIAPSTRQRSLVAGSRQTARWNKFGTPAALTAQRGALATGLAADPETAARQYLAAATTCSAWTTARSPTWRRCSSGRSARAPWCTLRQRFGELPAGQTAWSRSPSTRHGLPVSSSLARDTRPPAAGHPDRRAGVRRPRSPTPGWPPTRCRQPSVRAGRRAHAGAAAPGPRTR